MSYEPTIEYVINKDGKHLTELGGSTWFVDSIEVAKRFNDIGTAQRYADCYGGEVTIDQR